MAKFMHGRFAEKMKEFKHNRFMENLETVIFPGVGSFEIPEINPEQWIPCEFIGFNYATGCKSRTGQNLSGQQHNKRLTRNAKLKVYQALS